MSSAARVLSVTGAFVCFMGWIVPQSPNFRTPSREDLTKVATWGIIVGKVDGNSAHRRP
jgi:hypothetical protein